MSSILGMCVTFVITSYSKYFNILKILQKYIKAVKLSGKGLMTRNVMY